MTQPPYVPPRRDDPPTRTNADWPPAPDVPAAQDEPVREEILDAELFTPQFPDPVTTPGHGEPAVTSYSGGGATRDPSTTDVAKDQAGEVRDTAAEQGQRVAGVAKDQAAEVRDIAVEKGQQVAGVAKDEASKVAAEAGTQVRQLLSEGRSELSTQAGAQQQRLAGVVHSWAGELGAMASKSDQSGPLTDLAHEASRRGGEIAHWLESHEPSELLSEVKAFARRRPFTFLVASALAGVVVGRLTRGLAAEAKADSPTSAAPGSNGPELTSRPEPAPRENISLQEIPTSGSGAGPTTDNPDSEWLSDPTGRNRVPTSYGTASPLQTTGSFAATDRDDVAR